MGSGMIVTACILAFAAAVALTVAVVLAVRESVRRRRRAALRQQAREDLRRAFEARARRGGPRPPPAAARPYHAGRLSKAREQILSGVAGEFNPIYGHGACLGSAKSQVFADGWPGVVDRGDDDPGTGAGPGSGTGCAP